VTVRNWPTRKCGKSWCRAVESAVAASTDPMVVLQRNLDPIRREMVKWSEENVDGVLQQAGEKLGKRASRLMEKNTYPDATFTLRLSYGQVKGYPMNGNQGAYKTTLDGLYDRAQSFDFKGRSALPSRYVADVTNWICPRPSTSSLPTTSTAAIPAPGNQPRCGNRRLIFDGNIESLVGDFVLQR